jgi:L,D-peptidoglycan transpeptidase YkuD (ErfK/YbiS/YcfS/YnhG family)
LRTLGKIQAGIRSKRFVEVINAFPRWDDGSKGWVSIGNTWVMCALGKSGVTARKREGDGATPNGMFRITGGFVRRDRVSPARSALSAVTMRRLDGWCDDPMHGAYNRHVHLPFPGGHENLWRDDRVYDFVWILDHNQKPRRRNAGSAIFFHLIETGYKPTAGCVAVSPADMRRILPRLSRSVKMRIHLPADGNARPKNRGTDPDMRRP